MSMNIHIIKKKILNLINASMNIRRYRAKQNIILKTYYALKHCEPPEWRHLLCEQSF